MIKPEESVIVFDLDDTLYSEYDYKCSGIQAVVGIITSLYPQYDASVLNEIADNKSKDWLDNLCHHCKLNELEKQSLLWQYRLHRPVIRPYVEPSFLRKLMRPFAARALITDGRSLTQRLKIQALGLTDLFDDILISEAMQSEKPDDKRFVFLQNKYPAAKRFIYIGDNIKKDFVAPNKLGWLSIGIMSKPHNIHQTEPEQYGREYQPTLWINTLEELTTLTTSATEKANA